MGMVGAGGAEEGILRKARCGRGLMAAKGRCMGDVGNSHRDPDTACMMPRLGSFLGTAVRVAVRLKLCQL